MRGLIVCRGRDRTSVLEARQAERRADPDLRGPSCSRFHSQPSAPAVRRCIWCGLTKPIDDFAFRNRALGTRQSQCRECHATYRRTHYLRNRPEYIAREANRVREHRKQNRRLLQDYLRSHPCVDCGETDIVTLQFDHRDRATKRKEVALLVVQTAWSIVQTEIAKCDVRCANCHRRRTALQLGWRRLDGARTSVRATLIEAEIFPRKSGVRLCTGCGKAKPLEEFSYRDRARGLRRARCRSCVREYSREHYRQNKLRYATADWGRMRCSRQHLDREVEEYLRLHPCVDCGESDPLVLDFDHRDGVDKLGTIAFLRARGQRDELFGEIAKCEVRCSNCHQRRTAKQFGWAKLIA